jgi:RNA polymerase-binding protein DksA
MVKRPTRAKTSAAKTARAAKTTKTSARTGSKSKTPRLTAKEVEEFKKMLLAIRDKVVGNVSFLTKDSLQPMLAKDEDVDSVDHDFHLTMAGNEQNLLYEVDEAIGRIENGTYGICELTGEPIPKARLKAIPYARHTVEAQAELEGDRHRRRVVDLI